MTSKENPGSTECVEVEGLPGKHFIVEKDGEFLLQFGEEDKPRVYLTSAKVNSIEIARKLATNYILRERVLNHEAGSR